METIERIRNATFTLTRRGYDTREVDSYLSKLADWLEGAGADQVQGDTVKHELERIGRRTAKILTAAEEAAREMEADAQREAREITESARMRVDGIRTAAEEHAKRVRSEADTHAEKTVKEAEAKAIRMVEEGARRRREMEKVVADLQARRESVVKGLEKLSSQLAGAASAGKGVGDSSQGGSPAGADRQTEDVRGPAPPPAPTRQ